MDSDIVIGNQSLSQRQKNKLKSEAINNKAFERIVPLGC